MQNARWIAGSITSVRRLLGVEGLGSEPFRSFEMDAVEPSAARRELELFCMSFGDSFAPVLAGRSRDPLPARFRAAPQKGVEQFGGADAAQRATAGGDRVREVIDDFSRLSRRSD